MKTITALALYPSYVIATQWRLFVATTLLFSGTSCCLKADPITYNIVNYPADQDGWELTGFITVDLATSTGWLKDTDITSWSWSVEKGQTIHTLDSTDATAALILTYGYLHADPTDLWIHPNRIIGLGSQGLSFASMEPWVSSQLAWGSSWSSPTPPATPTTSTRAEWATNWPVIDLLWDTPSPLPLEPRRVAHVSDPASADFDFDSDVDGADFLKWQRGEVSDPPSAQDLALWENQFGNTLACAASVVIPEPTTLFLGALTTVGLFLRRRK
jgi:PEP-CTERM motif-containing protein